MGRRNGRSRVGCSFDPAKVSYAELVEFHYRMHDPTQVNSHQVRFGEAAGADSRTRRSTGRDRIAEPSTDRASSRSLTSRPRSRRRSRRKSKRLTSPTRRLRLLCAARDLMRRRCITKMLYRHCRFNRPVSGGMRKTTTSNTFTTTHLVSGSRGGGGHKWTQLTLDRRLRMPESPTPLVDPIHGVSCLHLYTCNGPLLL